MRTKKHFAGLLSALLAVSSALPIVGSANLEYPFTLTDDYETLLKMTPEEIRAISSNAASLYDGMAAQYADYAAHLEEVGLNYARMDLFLTQTDEVTDATYTDNMEQLLKDIDIPAEIVHSMYYDGYFVLNILVEDYQGYTAEDVFITTALWLNTHANLDYMCLMKHPTEATSTTTPSIEIDTSRFDTLLAMDKEELCAATNPEDPDTYLSSEEVYNSTLSMYQNNQDEGDCVFQFCIPGGEAYDGDEEALAKLIGMPAELTIFLQCTRYATRDDVLSPIFSLHIKNTGYNGFSAEDVCITTMLMLTSHPDLTFVSYMPPMSEETTTAPPETTITPTFEEFLTMSEEEICALSDEMSAEYTEGKRSYDYVKYNQVIQFLTFYDDSYREKPYDLFRDAGLPDGLVCNVVRGGGSEEIVSVDEDGNIIDSNGSHSFEYDYSLYPEYDEETVFIAGYLTLITSPLISDVLHDHVAGWDTPATTPSTTETTTTDTTPESTTTLAPETTTASAATTASATTAATTAPAATTTTTAAASGAASSPKTGDASAAALCMGAAAALAGMCLCRRKSR